MEGLVAQHLRAWVGYHRSPFEVGYWRTRSGVEVDFVVYGSDGFWAIEVKNASVVRVEDVRALRAFAADYPESLPLLLYRGRDRVVVNGIRCVPVEQFLVSLRPDRGLFEGL